MRFLTPEELGKITGFPDGYFNKLKVSKKLQVKMIGNAAPVNLAKSVIEPVAAEFWKIRAKSKRELTNG